MATDPTPERIAAALALAEACDDYFSGDAMVSGIVFGALQAYRATAPRLRTRAEVDAEIAGIMRDVYRAGLGSVFYSVDESLRLSRLCAEPTATEPLREPTRE